MCEFLALGINVHSADIFWRIISKHVAQTIHAMFLQFASSPTAQVSFFRNVSPPGEVKSFSILPLYNNKVISIAALREFGQDILLDKDRP